jgi:hypothetical protein
MDEPQALSTYRAAVAKAPRWNRRDICEAYAVLFFIAAKRAAHVRKCGKETYEQLKRMRFDIVSARRSSLTPNGLAIYAAAHLRELGSPMDCPVCDEHTTRYPCPFISEG